VLFSAVSQNPAALLHYTRQAGRYQTISIMRSSDIPAIVSDISWSVVKAALAKNQQRGEFLFLVWITVLHTHLLSARII
jgi:hypothetical protein